MAASTTSNFTFTLKDVITYLVIIGGLLASYYKVTSDLTSQIKEVTIELINLDKRVNKVESLDPAIVGYEVRRLREDILRLEKSQEENLKLIQQYGTKRNNGG